MEIKKENKEDRKERESRNEKDSDEKRSDKTPNNSLEKLLREEKQNKQTKRIVIIMAFLIIAILLVSWFAKESKKFEYVGLNFEKITFGELPLYHASIPITAMTGEIIANYNLYLRGDPRKSNVPIEGEIRLKEKLIIAVNDSMPACEDMGIAGVNLGQFLAAAGIESISGTTDMAKAINENIQWAGCDFQNEFASILVITEGNETKITQKLDDCYTMEVANCEILEATERFIIGAIAKSGGYEV